MPLNASPSSVTTKLFWTLTAPCPPKSVTCQPASDLPSNSGFQPSPSNGAEGCAAAFWICASNELGGVAVLTLELALEVWAVFWETEVDADCAASVLAGAAAAVFGAVFVLDAQPVTSSSE